MSNERARRLYDYIAATQPLMRPEFDKPSQWAKANPDVGESPLSNWNTEKYEPTLPKCRAVAIGLGRPLMEVLHAIGDVTDDEMLAVGAEQIPPPDVLHAIAHDPRLDSMPKVRAQLLSLAQHFLLPD